MVDLSIVFCKRLPGRVNLHFPSFSYGFPMFFCMFTRGYSQFLQPKDHRRPPDTTDLAGVTSARRAALLGAVSAVTLAGQEKAEAFGKNPSDWLGYYKDRLGIDGTLMRIWEFIVVYMV